MNLPLYYHTVRYLKLAQIAARARLAFGRPRADLSPAPPRRQMSGKFPPPLRGATLIEEDVFRFLNVTQSIEPPRGWNDLPTSRLWLYNLHYFDDLNAVGREHRTTAHQKLIARWTRENPPTEGVGWEPYPISLRIVNWVKWASSGFRLTDDAAHSLAVQARYLRRRLEYHLLGNHLLANAKALVFAGSFFDGRQADEWLAEGIKILQSELAEQILPDGGHFERSPMYHSIVLEDLLDLLALSDVFPSLFPVAVVDGWTHLIGKMFEWLDAMCHPDGDIAFFNDSAFGIALTPAQLRARAGALSLDVASPSPAGMVRLSSSGYLRIERRPMLVVFDAAPVGPDYLPGHAHADTLSFELSWGARRIFSNSGTSTYSADSRRCKERSTAAHNTVEIDDENSSEVWSAFRVARRARIADLEARESFDALYAACSHDGYARLKGAPRHRREIELSASALRVSDTISGRGFHRVAGYFHVHPGLGVDEMSPGEWRISVPDGPRLRVICTSGARLQREASDHSPEFGKVLPRPALVWRLDQELPVRTSIEISEVT